jgi:hypothetical protein
MVGKHGRGTRWKGTAGDHKGLHTIPRMASPAPLHHPRPYGCRWAVSQADAYWATSSVAHKSRFITFPEDHIPLAEPPHT